MLLSGRDIADYIKQRHFTQVRGMKTPPGLAIINASSDPATDSYLRAKQSYGKDIGVDVEVHTCLPDRQAPPPTTEKLVELIKRLNQDESTTGIIVQLPLPESVDTDKVLAAIEPSKDIDGLGPESPYDSATATGIMWLLAAYNIDFKAGRVVVVGQGRLIGSPLSQILENSGAQVIRCDEHTKDLKSQTLQADILISATGVPNLIKPGMVKTGAVVIDAAGDADPKLYDDDSLKITPPRGGVGPMTVAALFDNLIRASES